jgi:hypothetical protein
MNIRGLWKLMMPLLASIVLVGCASSGPMTAEDRDFQYQVGKDLGNSLGQILGQAIMHR